MSPTRKVFDDDSPDRISQGAGTNIFRPLVNYLLDCFSKSANVNEAFRTGRLHGRARALSESSIGRPSQGWTDEKLSTEADNLAQLDPKMLLLGDVAENGSWWTSDVDRIKHRGSPSAQPQRSGEEQPRLVNFRSPRLDWHDVSRWYDRICNVDHGWREKLNEICSKITAEDGKDGELADEELLKLIDAEQIGRAHV